MDPISAFQRSGDVFVERLALVPAGAWDNATPCPEWNVRIVAAHVVNGFGLIEATLAGQPVDAAHRNADHLGADPVAAAQAALATAITALQRPGALAAVVTPPAGPMPAARFAMVRVTDNVIHTWDLARGAGIDDSLPADLIEIVSAAAPTQFLARGRQVGLYGHEIIAPDDASPLVGLLARFGRAG